MQDEVKFKMPKQWKHWCADMKLKVHGRKFTKAMYQWYYLKGRGHYWRVNCYAMFQCGDNYEEFDRWARCDIEEVPLPKTREEFRRVVKAMLETKKQQELQKGQETNDE